MRLGSGVFAGSAQKIDSLLSVFDNVKRVGHGGFFKSPSHYKAIILIVFYQEDGPKVIFHAEED
jgi:hypothetical protein